MTVNPPTADTAEIRPEMPSIFDDFNMSPQDRAAAEEWLRMREAGGTCLPLIICGDMRTGKTCLLERLEERFGHACRAESPAVACRAAAAGKNVTLDDGYSCGERGCGPAQKYADAEQLGAVAVTVLGWRGPLPPHFIHLHGTEEMPAPKARRPALDLEVLG